MSQSHKINVKVNSGEKIVHVNLKQGVDFIKILSLELDSEDTYQLHTSNYGVVVGRVLANGSYGIPNVKVSAFIPLEDIDKEDSIISTEYPYSTMQVKNIEGKKYNILPNSTYGGYDGKHKPIGSFPNKREVLDNEGQIEVFDKYWKYTTVTNEFGDYMLFGIPTGVTQMHIDCDISDIGILSQRPYDLIAKGYDANLFASMTEFKTDNIENTPQIMTQNKTITVFPFWGDKDENRIGITRCDIQLDYDFTPCCIFLGSTITDSTDGYIGTEGMPNGSIGNFNSLKTSTGNIEVLRRTLDGHVEYLTENVNNIIDGNGVWCYQIPMNLDRISMDEEGNLIQENDPNKGIPTRARVRMRISLNDNDGMNTAMHLIPNNPKIYPEWNEINQGRPFVQIHENKELNLEMQQKLYKFNDETPDCCFRDLFWNKVYSVKGFYPRFQYGLNDPRQTGPDVSNGDYAGYYQDYSQMPINFAAPFCCIHSISPSKFTNPFPYNTMYAGAENQAHDAFNDDVHKWFGTHATNESTSDFITKGIHFSFENDWVNGCLYFPKVLISKDDYFGAKNDKGEKNGYSKIYLSGRHNFKHTNKTYTTKGNNDWDKWRQDGDVDSDSTRANVDISKFSYFTQVKMKYGIVTKETTNTGGSVYYYRHGGNDTSYKRLFATDIICLGNLIDTLDNLPHLYEKIPATTAKFPPMSAPYNLNESGMNMNGSRMITDIQWGSSAGSDIDNIDIFGNYYLSDSNQYNGKLSSYTSTTNEARAFYEECYNSRGQDWKELIKTAQERYALFFGQRSNNTCNYLHYLPTTFVNTSRICELGVMNDHSFVGKSGHIYAINGMIDRFDIADNHIRSEFASINYDPTKFIIDEQTRRRCFLPTPLYMVDFDGRLSGYTSVKNFKYIDEKTDKSYVKFRYRDDYGYQSQEGNQYVGPMSYPIRSEVGTPNENLVNYDDFPFNPEFSYSAIKHTLNGDGVSYNIFEYDMILSEGQKIVRAVNAVDSMNASMVLPENSFYFYFGLSNGFSALDKLYGKYYSPTQS